MCQFLRIRPPRPEKGQWWKFSPPKTMSFWSWDAIFKQKYSKTFPISQCWKLGFVMKFVRHDHRFLWRFCRDYNPWSRNRHPKENCCFPTDKQEVKGQFPSFFTKPAKEKYLVCCVYTLFLGKARWLCSLLGVSGDVQWGYTLRYDLQMPISSVPML